jgi:ATP phosphoribosyltransferase
VSGSSSNANAGGGKLVLAVPSKGRLQENAAHFFARAGLDLVQPGGARDYRGGVRGVEGVEVLFVSAAEIVGQLATGSVHIGVTGEDLVREKIAAAESTVELLTPLGFGQAHVVVAVPQAWIDVRTMDDLDEVAADMRARHGTKMRVATKYVNLTRRFFAQHGLADYRIVESLGATEGAPATGAAEIIVDITTTGTTLAANGLKVLEDGTMLKSQANLVASLKACWSDTARQAAAAILARIAAEEEARTTREVTARAPRLAADQVAALAEKFAARPSPGAPQSAGAIALICPIDGVFALVEALTAAGAEGVSVRQLDYAFRQNDALSERLFRRLGAK